MIKNPSDPWNRTWRALFGFGALLLVAWSPADCQQAQAKEPSPLQGVIEHEDRVIGFEVAGRIVEVNVSRGQHLKPGAVVARLDDTLEKPVRALRAAEVQGAEAQLALLQAGTRVEEIRASQAQIAALDSQADITRKNLVRQQSLLAQGALPPNVVDETSAALAGTLERKRALQEQLKAQRRGARDEEIAAAIARVDAARAALAAQDERMGRYTLTTLSEGDVTDVHIEPGEMGVPAAPAVTLADLDHPYVDVFVPQARISQVQVGLAAQVHVDGIDAPLPGKVEHVYPKTEFTPRYLFSQAERSNLVLRVRVRIDDPKHLLHAGVPAFVTLHAAAQS